MNKLLYLLIIILVSILIYGVFFYKPPKIEYKQPFIQACMKVENDLDICSYEYLKILYIRGLPINYGE